jgi:hypothetical protein
MFRIYDESLLNAEDIDLMKSYKMDLYLVEDCGEIYWAISNKHTNCQTQLMGPRIKFIASAKTLTGDEAPCDDVYCTICNSKRQNPNHF